MPDVSSSLEAWLQYLERLHPCTIDMGLERVRAVAGRLLDFQRLPPAVTVTGTNGKGTCVHALDAIAGAHGLRAGMYCSPHLLHFGERIRVAGRPVSDRSIVEAFAQVESARDEISLTYFEFGTLAALWLFAQASVDVLFLEVGLGGRLDAVNVIDADVAVITSIGLDHQEWLGTTRESVCREKAGIRRRGRVLICGDVDPPAVLSQLCSADAVPLAVLGEDFTLAADGMLCSGNESLLRLPIGNFVASNLASAVMAWRAILPQLGRSVWDPDSITRALEELSIPGRRQCLSRAPDVWVDVAHNPHAATSLATWLASRGRWRAVVGMLSDKDVVGTVSAIAPMIDAWYLSDLPGPRGLRADELARMTGISPVAMLSSPIEALNRALADANVADSIIIFGSFLTVSDILAHHDRSRG